jgi:hypothetical protein
MVDPPNEAQVEVETQMPCLLAVPVAVPEQWPLRAAIAVRGLKTRKR